VNFIKGSIEEIRKVTWPTKDQAIKLTIITIIFTIFCTAVLALSDYGFSKGYNYLLKISPKVQNQQVNLNTDNNHTPAPVEIDNSGITAVDEDGNPAEVEVNFEPSSSDDGEASTE